MLRVMQSFSALRDTTNPYLKQLFTAVSGGVEPSTFSWSAALGGRFDVLHIHWPEVLIQGSNSRKTWLRRGAFLLLLLRIRFSHRALVRTLHNLAPHENQGRIDRYLLTLCDRYTTLWIKLVPSTPTPAHSHSPVRVIPHGDYRDWFAGLTVPEPIPGRLIFFGLIRAYKGVDDILRAFATLVDDSLSLRIVGGVKDLELAAQVTSSSQADPRITARLEYVTDADLAAEIGASELVTLPYRDMHNSGSALLALSLNRPILVPANEVTVDLAAEVGRTWVQTYSGALTANVVREALTAVRGGLPQTPDLSGRSWDIVGAAHIEAYQAAVTAAQR